MPLILPTPSLARPDHAPSLGRTSWAPASRCPSFAVSPGGRLNASWRSPLAIAQAFATELGIDIVHDTVEALSDNPAVDVVNVATPHGSYVRDGRLESPFHPHSEIVDVMATHDTARRTIRAVSRE